MKHKVVYNDCYGGYALSDKAINWLEEYSSERTKKFIDQRRLEVSLSDLDGDLDNITDLEERNWSVR